MAKVEKIIVKMKNQPHSISYEDAAKVLNYYGYLLVRSNGSHMHFRNDKGDLITIKKDTPTIKIPYVKDILVRIGE
ncbi:type II toxin-antitoxin system HicA family toxin [Paenibacillus radicis (ex Xue et al. 2023)]|uniref:Type II toxin-antitoxin system HicA family toxin n=1 Tax=Paenibacillus radicis (ex Xue et al. 2023) TaxID=2972489 RepID=A0ABT1Y9G2_9BACL|nr:type II toxin-antitoxin system HicA family toxin [Paenibacillus radicis (ex Xue et al. 2023)]MCR8629828.1 type II toxin-antitoxin system HicA family toxin [Paenibacillus radicis (ex Xue et al. 2023)]